jgi:uncharacterized protein
MTTTAPDGPHRTRSDLLLFTAVTLVVSWVPLAVTIVAGRQGDVWFLIGTSGPTLAALLLWLAGRRRPRGPVRPVLARARAWVPAALVFGLLPSVAAVVATGQDVHPAAMIAGVGGVAPAVVMLFLAGPLAEEFGWRGYVQPRLRRRFGPVATSVVLGVCWAAWHLPLFFVPGTGQAEMGLGSLAATLFLAAFLPLSYLFWFVTEHLSGGVAAAVLMHAALNAGITFGGVSSDAAMAVVLATATVAALAVAALTPRRAAPVAAPGTPVRPAR